MEHQQPRAVYPKWLFSAILILVAGLALIGGSYGTKMYDLANPQVSTVISVSSTTNTVSQTQTSTASTTLTVTSSTTSTTTASAQNPYLYGNPYPYQNQYGNQISMTGIIYNQGDGCIYLQTNGNYYALSGNIPGNIYTNQQLTVYGYFDGTSSQCGAVIFIVSNSY